MDVLEKLKEFKWLILSSFILLLSVLLLVIGSQKKAEPAQSETDPLEELLLPGDLPTVTEAEEEGEIDEIPFVLVDVKGAVHHPGVYQLEGSSRVIDAITIAGGLKEEAVTKHVNFAKELVDEMLIYIPVEGEEIAEIPQEGEAGENNQKININTASASELETLSGIGPQKAQGIIQYREEEGDFQTIEELTNVSGIGEKTFEKLKDAIIVD
ncbi:helix-hairpin-helix domain-containing protein [Alkalibacterium iburiense]|uniref:Helix-hairpin-helix domain-containing protein n=1 Tax=Alkalibacterium iburiense TaxID=290589 RepID=A0ABN0XKK3_9LACT